MIRKRIKNDVSITWILKRKDGTSVDLSLVRNLCVYVRHSRLDIAKKQEYDVVDNVIFLHFLASEQKIAGVYDLHAKWEQIDESIEGGIASFALDYCNAFELVEKSCELTEEEQEDEDFVSIVGEALRGNPGYPGKTPVIGTISATSVASDQNPSFTLSDSGNVDDDGNPIYTGSISIPEGNEGAAGKAPVLVIGEVLTVDPDVAASVSITPDGFTDEGNPKFVISLSIPKGNTGSPGDGAGNVLVLNVNDALSTKQYVLKPKANGSTEYYIEEMSLPTHAHDDRYYTESEVDTKLSGKADKSTTYTKTETDMALGGKVDKVEGKSLSTEDYTTAEKTKLGGIAAGAEANVQSDWNETNTEADGFIKNKPTALPPTAHTHDYAPTSHAHDDRKVYRQTIIPALKRRS